MQATNGRIETRIGRAIRLVIGARSVSKIRRMKRFYKFTNWPIPNSKQANSGLEESVGTSGYCYRQKTDGRCSVGCPQPTRCSEPIGWGQPTLQRWQYPDAIRERGPILTLISLVMER